MQEGAAERGCPGHEHGSPARQTGASQQPRHYAGRRRPWARHCTGCRRAHINRVAGPAGRRHRGRFPAPPSTRFVRAAGRRRGFVTARLHTYSG